MKYKVGDKVRVRKDLVDNSEYGEELFTGEMMQFVGKVVTISELLDDDEYFIRETNSDYVWTDEMFDGLANDAIKPNYYQFHGYDVFDIADHFGLDFPLGNALKYILRHKDETKRIEDLKKARQCLDRAIELMEKRHIELEG